MATPDGQVAALPLGGLPLTSKVQIEYRSHAFRLPENALLIVHTNGAVEYRDLIAGERRS